MRSQLKRVKVVTAKNTPTEGGGTDVTYDKVFLPSLEEMYITKQSDGEGAYHPYWKMRAGTDTPAPWWKDNDRYKNYALENHTSAQYVRLRSANVGNCNNTWGMNTSGDVNSGSISTGALRALPLVAI